MDYKSIRQILDASRDKLEDLALRIACEYPIEFRKCAIMNGLIDDLEIIVSWNNEKLEVKSSVMNQLRDYADAQRRPDMVKLLRNETGIGLKDALETCKIVFPQAFEDRSLKRNPCAEQPLFFSDRRPTDPGYYDPQYHAPDEEFDHFVAPVIPEGFNDDQPRGVTLSELLDAVPADVRNDVATGVSLGELLRDQIKQNEQPTRNFGPVDWSRYNVPQRDEG